MGTKLTASVQQNELTFVSTCSLQLAQQWTLVWLQSKLRNTLCHASIPAPNAREADYNMWQMYVRYWKPFGELLTDMEKEGMLVNRCALPNAQIHLLCWR
jgi:hypothetical protein